MAPNPNALDNNIRESRATRGRTQPHRLVGREQRPRDRGLRDTCTQARNRPMGVAHGGHSGGRRFDLIQLANKKLVKLWMRSSRLSQNFDERAPVKRGSTKPRLRHRPRSSDLSPRFCDPIANLPAIIGQSPDLRSDCNFLSRRPAPLVNRANDEAARPRPPEKRLAGVRGPHQR